MKRQTGYQWGYQSTWLEDWERRTMMDPAKHQHVPDVCADSEICHYCGMPRVDHPYKVGADGRMVPVERRQP